MSTCLVFSRHDLKKWSLRESRGDSVMYYRDHDAAHFHAKYGAHEITVRLADGIVEGRFPRRALNHVMESHALHREELSENWELARSRNPLKPIPPLE